MRDVQTSGCAFGLNAVSFARHIVRGRSTGVRFNLSGRCGVLHRVSWPHSISHVGRDESAEGKLVGQILLGGLGVLLLAAGVWGGGSSSGTIPDL
jgi:hypothetical protein